MSTGHATWRPIRAAALADFRTRPELSFSDPAPTLEDVFIDLMSRSRDNFQ